MNTKKYNWALYFITATILTTISVQLYWNYKNYQENKQRVLNEISISFESSIYQYYSYLFYKNILPILDPEKKNYIGGLKESDIFLKVFNNDSLFFSKILKKSNVIFKENKDLQSEKPLNSISNIKSSRKQKTIDSIKLLKELRNTLIAINNHSLEYNKLDTLLTKSLNDKKIEVDFAFKHFKNDSLIYDYKSNLINDNLITITPRTTYFKRNELIQLLHTNPSKETLKKSSTGILLSLILSLGVISSLFYLLKIINQQKKLAEIKNDLISNITHEFKTPITTIATALDALNNFNAINNREKTKNYLSISSVQLKKLHQMVEKLLETATLDSENLLLKKEPINLVEFIKKIIKKHQLNTPNKSISFSSTSTKIVANIDADAFHLENAISNLIDNAIKYGGNTIEVSLKPVVNFIEIFVTDNGKAIDKNQQEKIFDKFYRIPTGNIHDVKGFGIGLYYAKKIIEKHQGNIYLLPNLKNTVFKIVLPNG